MPTLFLPRRHHRHLLLPPGLVALAWLLLLGCLALPRMKGTILSRQAVVEILIDPRVSAADLKYVHPAFRRWQLRTYNPILRWNSIEFNDGLFADYFTSRQTQDQLQHLKRFPHLVDSVRVQFGSHAIYKQLVQTINEVQENDRSTRLVYWLASHDQSIYLYAFPSGKENTGQAWICGTTSTSWFERSWLDQLWTLKNNPSSVPYFFPEWRNTWLLLLLSLVSTWKLTRLRIADRY